MPKAPRNRSVRKRSCPICNREFHPSAFTAHFKKCERDKRMEDGAREYEREMIKKLFERVAVPGGSANKRGDTSDNNVAFGSSEHQSLPEIEVPRSNAASPADVTDGTTIDETRIEYHPRSRKHAKVCRFEKYDSESTHRQCSTVTEPWWPNFNTREDFLFAELIHEARLNNQLLEKLIKLVNRCIDGKGVITFKGPADVEAAWKRASSTVTTVS